MTFRLLSSGAVLCVVAIGLGTSVLVEGCIDTCVLSGKACNVSSDCEGGEVCLHPGPDDVGCPVVTGTCEVGACGNDLDCEAGCCNLETRQCGFVLDACAGPAQCGSDGECGFGEQCVVGTCRSTCDNDFECPGSERCQTTCQAPIGTICSIDAGFGECFHGDCVDINATDQQVAPYCTESCNLELVGSTIEDTKFTCPDGYACVDYRCLQE